MAVCPLDDADGRSYGPIERSPQNVLRVATLRTSVPILRARAFSHTATAPARSWVAAPIDLNTVTSSAWTIPEWAGKAGSAQARGGGDRDCRGGKGGADPHGISVVTCCLGCGASEQWSWKRTRVERDGGEPTLHRRGVGRDVHDTVDECRSDPERQPTPDDRHDEHGAA